MTDLLQVLTPYRLGLSILSLCLAYWLHRFEAADCSDPAQ